MQTAGRFVFRSRRPWITLRISLECCSFLQNAFLLNSSEPVAPGSPQTLSPTYRGQSTQPEMNLNLLMKMIMKIDHEFEHEQQE